MSATGAASVPGAGGGEIEHGPAERLVPRGHVENHVACRGVRVAPRALQRIVEAMRAGAVVDMTPIWRRFDAALGRGA